MARMADGAADRSALAGVRGLLLDLDGVVVLKGEALPGAAAAIAELDRRQTPYRIVTNTSFVSRASLARFGTSIGIDVTADRIMSALSVSAADTARRFPGAPIFVMASPDALTEFAGQHVLTKEEALAPGATAAAVVVGDSPESVTYDNLNAAFRLIRGGAELIGMHRNRWWLTPNGPTVDSGAVVAGLEYAAEVRARIVGKPTRAFFVEAAAALAADIAAMQGRRPVRSELAMVGDDIRTDVQAAQRIGLRGVFVLSGKQDERDLAAATAGDRSRRPDLVAASLEEVVAALDPSP
jgi:HAD superfamily hydrolase (TIGR01458 family)